MTEPISFKIRNMLVLFGLSLFIIFLRVWYLSVINYEKMQKLSELPRRRTQLILPTRGLIYDSKGELLAANKQQFTLSILYQEIKEIPSCEIRYDKGQKIKIAKRKAYIESLCQFLAPYTGMKAEAIEDFIYAKAALFQDMPLMLFENLSLRDYSVLKLKEKDWPGLKISVSHKRVYPREKVGCHILGYMGAIDDKTYHTLIQEQHRLKTYIEERERGLTPPLPSGFSDPLEVRNRYDILLEKGYHIQDSIGKEGIEKTFDLPLRGGAGKIRYEVTRSGQIISQLPGSYDKQKPASIELSIDLELQKEAECLLAARESGEDLFCKEGAIVVVDLKNSHVLALASYPRFNPQDFNDKNIEAIHQWTESDLYLQHLYEGTSQIEKEHYTDKQGFFCTHKILNYPLFLNRLLSPKSSVLKKIQSLRSAGEALTILQEFETYSTTLVDQSPEMLIKALSKHPLLEGIEDPLLYIDLLRLLIDPARISSSVAPLLETLPLNDFFALSQDIARLSKQLRLVLKKPFEETLFSSWKKAHFKSFLKQKRAEENRKRTYARPYTDYLEQELQRQYREFCDHTEKYFIAYLLKKVPYLKPDLQPLVSSLQPLFENPDLLHLTQVTQPLDLEQTAAFLKMFRPFKDLNRPLLGSYPRLLEKTKHFEKNLALSFYPKYKLGYLRSNAYRLLAPQGSVFKVAVAYQALKEQLESFAKPLPIIIDSLQASTKNAKEQILGYDETKGPIRRWHKGGLLPRSSHSGIGKVDLVSALEQSSNIYFSLLASEYISNPQNLIQSAKNFGLSTKTGIDLPFEPKGKLPEDLAHNKTGLYAFAIGQHELLVTPLQTAMMISSLFQNGRVHKPVLVQRIYEQKKSMEDLFDHLDIGSLQKPLADLGCYFPLFTEDLKPPPKILDNVTEAQIKSSYDLNPHILNPIVKGLDRVLWGPKGTARPAALAPWLSSHEMSAYMNLAHQLVGKTGTAEQRIIETLDKEADSRMLNHIWFAGLSFEDRAHQKPELAFCVYLKDGKKGGREAAALAVKLLQKYRTSHAQ